MILINAFLLSYLLLLGVRFGSVDAIKDYLGGKTLLVRNKVVSIGAVRTGSQVRDSHFDLVNAGAEPVRIVGGIFGCRCTEPTNLPLLIGPGMRERLTFSLDLRNVRPGEPNGYIVIYKNIFNLHNLYLKINVIIVK